MGRASGKITKQYKTFEDINLYLAQYSLKDDSITSGSFAAVVKQTGVRQLFRKLQVLLGQIAEMEPEIHEYASGAIFEDLIEEFQEAKARSPFDLKDLFGETDPPQERDIIKETRDRIRRVATAMDLVEQARDLIKSMYDRVEGMLTSTEEGFLSREQRTENLIDWAERTGAMLNSDIENFGNVVIETKSSTIMTDLRGLLEFFDQLEVYLGILAVLPAYYRTGVSADTQNITIPTKSINVKRDYSIERIAEEELGDADKATMIMEFNGLSFSDVQGAGWDGREIKIPYLEEPPERMKLYNFVLDAMAGEQALGKDLPDELEVSAGDLKVLNYTNTFFQSLSNIIATPLGAIAEMPDYGSRVAGFIGGAVPEISEGTAAIEVARALSTNPRVAYITDVTVKKEQDAVKIKYHAIAANRITEAQLTGSLDTS